jgi:hypothetical protein
MSPDALRNPPAQWKAFLQEVDQLLQSAVELHCLGGFDLSVLYDLPRPTADVDAWFCASQETREVPPALDRCRCSGGFRSTLD